MSRYLRYLALGDASALTGRSYGYDVLRWFRVLWAVDIGWEQATEAETTAMVGWLRTAPNPQRRRSRLDSIPAGVVNPKTGKSTLRDGYAPRTIAHALTVVHASSPASPRPSARAGSGRSKGSGSVWLEPETSLLKWTDERPAVRRSTSACRA
ncbi:hypothetical protein GCM10010393_15590 [Streptomyces gobitricini]|uniref:Integrase SAM-like N-terminal domain-containing protein n=1 Tax=Streptomyces gobitricini TaxID=68211 RepID=A0ABP5YR02_9ACTN